MRKSKKMPKNDATKKQNNKPKRFVYRPLALAISTILLATPNIGQSATYTVSNSQDSGAGSLRQALFFANSDNIADIIDFSIPSSSVISLQSELQISNGSLTITGPTGGDSGSIILQGNGTHRIINASSFVGGGKTVTLENITLTNGFESDYGGFNDIGGAGIAVDDSAILILNNVLVSNNSTSGYHLHGGGIFSSSNITLNNTTVSGNSTTISDGGGIAVSGANLTLNESTVSNNSTDGDYTYGGGINIKSGNIIINKSNISGNSTTGSPSRGGGIRAFNGDTTINHSTISNNVATGDRYTKGGGLSLGSNSTVIINQSTISGNSTSGSAGGIQLHISSGSSTITHSTITNNSANSGAGGISAGLNFTYGNSITLKNSILSGNNGPSGNFKNTTIGGSGKLNVQSSLFGDPLFEITGNSIGAYFDASNDPKLDALKDNGGPTLTHKPLPINSSQIINTGNNTFAASFTNDQRRTGFTRIHNINVDMGAVEWHPSPTEVLTRRDMARKIIEKIEGPAYTPPFATGNEYDDVGSNDINADWIEELKSRGFTEGCAPNRFCPNMIVTKDQMAKVYSKAKGLVSPPANSGNTFFDVSSGNFGWQYTTALRDNNWSEGCSSFFFGFPVPSVFTNYCPDNPVFREWFDNLLDDL